MIVFGHGCNFNTDWLRLDCSSSQGELAKACLAERIPFAGLTLSEAHSTKLEVILTNFVLSLMQSEGSTYYRPDASAMAAEASRKRKHAGDEEDTTDPKPKGKAKAKGKPKATPKANPSPEETGAGQKDEEVQGAEAEEGDDLPW